MLKYINVYQAYIKFTTKIYFNDETLIVYFIYLRKVGPLII